MLWGLVASSYRFFPPFFLISFPTFFFSVCLVDQARFSAVLPPAGKQGNNKALGLHYQECPCLFAYRSQGVTGDALMPGGNNTRSEPSKCDQIAQDGF